MFCEYIAPLRANQIARITSDFKIDVIKFEILEEKFISLRNLAAGLSHLSDPRGIALVFAASPLRALAFK